MIFKACITPFMRRNGAMKRLHRYDEGSLNCAVCASRLPTHDAALRFRWRKRRAGWLAHALVNEALETPAVEIFADIDVALAVDCKRMRHVQRSAKNALLSDVIDDFERVAQKDPDVVVCAVDHVKEALIGRKGEP